MKFILIGIHGGRQHGKSTLARLLKEALAERGFEADVRTFVEGFQADIDAIKGNRGYLIHLYRPSLMALGHHRLPSRFYDAEVLNAGDVHDLEAIANNLAFNISEWASG